MQSDSFLCTKKSRSYFPTVALFVTFFLAVFCFSTKVFAETYTGFVSVNATNGGTCYLIGVWNSDTKSCTLNKDLLGQLAIYSPGITIDGSGHIISRDTRALSFQRNGVVVSGSNSIIKNLHIKSFSFCLVLGDRVTNTFVENSSFSFCGSSGIYMFASSSDNTFRNNNFSNNYLGILVSSSNNLIENNTFSFNSPYALRLYFSSNNIIKENTITNSHNGIYMEYGSGNRITNNTIENSRTYGLYTVSSIPNQNYFVNNNFINNGDGQTNFHNINQSSDALPIGGNYWSDYDTPAEGCNDIDNNGICDQPKYLNIYNRTYGDFLPWVKKDGWKITLPPEEYFAKIIGAPNGVAKMYNASNTGSALLKTFPNDWILKVFSETLTVDNWIKVKDMTDNSEGWIQGGFNVLPYNRDMQTELENTSSLLMTTKAQRANKIVEIVNYYYNDTNTASSLYSSNDSNLKISLLKEKGFPVELILAIIAQESGIISYNNEFVSYDYGHGIMQITFQGWFNEPNNYIKNSWDNRGRFSKNLITLCKNFDPLLPKGNQGFRDYYDCYQNAGTKNNLTKFYKNYKNDLNNFKYKQYTNTVQSMYANIKDGIGSLRTKVSSKCPNPSITIQGIIFTCNDIEKIFAVWGYNGRVVDPTVNYLHAIANKLETISTHFPGQSYHNNDQLVTKLKIANDNRKAIKVFSSVDIQVVNSSGQKLGVFNDNIFEEIPNSSYNSDYESAVVFFPTEDLAYKLIGTEEGNYGLIIDSTEEGEQVIFKAVDLPIAEKEIHTYKINHDILLSGGKGVFLEIDSEGDGVVDRTLNVGTTLSDINPPKINIDNILGEYILGEAISPVVSALDESLPVDVKFYLNGTFVGLQNILLNKPGENIFKVVAVDAVGNEAVKVINFNVRYVFSGLLPPLQNNDYGIYRLGSTIPVKFKLSDIAGKNPESSIAQLSAKKVTNSILGNEEYNVISTNANQGSVFRYDINGNQYIYNLATKSLSVGTWMIGVLLYDGSTHNVLISLR